MAEKKKLLYQMNVISEESPDYIDAAAGLEINMIYPDIPLEEKILIFRVERDEEVIERMKQKVEKAREFLENFEKKFITQDRYEWRSIFDSLDFAWELLRKFPKSDLDKINPQLLEEYYPRDWEIKKLKEQLHKEKMIENSQA